MTGVESVTGVAAVSIGSPMLWVGFIALVLVLIALDLFVLGGRKANVVTPRQAAGWSVLWVSVAMAFAAGLWWYLNGTLGREVADAKTLEFLTGYLIEKALSVDNIFVFLMIFGFFQVPPEYQRRVLVYGVLGAIVMRAAMIIAGAALVSHFSWVLYVFGAFLVITGVKMLVFADKESDLSTNPLLRWLRGHLRVTDEYHGAAFSIRRDGVRWFTPMFLVLILIETSDVIFAVDSIPAIFAVTTDPFIVFTSNIFAILGLRALYFLLADMASRFHLLKYGLALVLVFVGSKMLVAHWYHIPVSLALGVVALTIGVSIIASLLATRQK